MFVLLFCLVFRVKDFLFRGGGGGGGGRAGVFIGFFEALRCLKLGLKVQSGCS